MSHCTFKCHSKRHTYELNVAVQNGTTEQAKAYLSTCSNAFRGLDIYGRNLLHVASANGKNELLSWLLDRAKGSLNTKDKESGWTALHRAIFYGQIVCAVSLIKHGAALTCKDNENLTAIDLCTKDHIYMPFVQSNTEIGEYNVYTWGDNSSYTLGHGKESRALHPEVVDVFRRKHITIAKVLMKRYHSVFLTSHGAIYTCGHGRGGRLGLGHENPTLYPMNVKLPQVSQAVSGGSGDAPTESVSTLKIDDIAAGRDHTLLLGANGRVYSFGSNDHKQLGIYPDPAGKVTEPKMVNAKLLVKGPPMMHIAAGRFHSVMATDSSIYTFGLNAGQLGHTKGEKYIRPKVVSALSKQDGSRVTLVDCCDAATVVVLVAERREGFYVLYNYTSKFISFRGAKFDKRICRLAVSGGQLDHSMLPDLLQERGGATLRVCWINYVGQLFLWTEDGGAAIRKVTYSSLGRQLSLIDVSSSLSDLLVTTEEGGAYLLTPSDKNNSSSSDPTRFPSAVPTVDMKVKRVPGVHRATSCSMDYKSNNFAILQAKEYTCFFAEVEDSGISREYNSLLETADELDGVSDVVITCNGERVPCHKYILASRSSYFSKLVSQLSSAEDSVQEENVDTDVFYPNFPTFTMQEISVPLDSKTLRFILRYIYSGRMDRELLFGTSSQTIHSKNRAKHKQNEERQQQERIQELCKKYGIKSKARSQSTSGISYTMSSYSKLTDVILTTSDGKELKCHKCVLVARMEYFRTMFAGDWFEGQDRIVRMELPIPSDILSAVLLYIYSDGHSHLQETDIEFMVNVMVVADQLLLSRLKGICESLIVSQLTLDNLTQVYQLATLYQTTQLKEAAQLMICLNMSEMLELSLLEELELELLEELTRAYRKNLRCISRRHLSRMSEPPTASDMDQVIQDLKQDEELSTSSKRTRRRTRTSSNSSVEIDVTAAVEGLKIEVDDFAGEFENISSTKMGAGSTSPLSPVSTPSPRAMNSNADVLKSTTEGGEIFQNSSQSITDRNTSWKQNSVGPKSQDALTESKPGVAGPSIRDIMSQEEKSGAMNNQNSSKLKTSRRRKYRSLDEVQTEQKVASPVAAITSSRGSAWTTTTSTGESMSLKQVMEREEALQSSAKPADHPTSLKLPPAGKTRWKAPVVVSKPAWNMPKSPPPTLANENRQSNDTCNQHTSPTQTLPPSKLLDIITQEELHTKELLRNANKPLINVQIEERAIEELTAKYMATKRSWEKISVERVVLTTTGTPLWKNST